ncbi:MAG: proline dehydrogenase family protein, partial [Candidatus Marinimicrobia bacterium]|nr:proline dehydrogenase family protein [Candidatus Neomarinimicrobiota bacterium]
MNRILVWLLPRLPKALAARFAGRYVAGESVETALTAARDLNERGFEVTLDILGEHVTAAQEARDVTQAYVHLFGAMAANSIKGNISVKPTHLGLDLSADLCRDNFIALLDAAREQDNFLRIDMESSRQTDATLALYRELAARYPRVGPVLQAYPHRSADDLARPIDKPLNFRL